MTHHLLPAVGIDIEEINRFDVLATDKAFLDKIYTEQELAYCFSKPLPAQHLAARFAAKEAAIKALAQLGLRQQNLKGIEVTKSANGVPELKISSVSDMVVKVSLSHNRISAIAIVLILKI